MPSDNRFRIPTGVSFGIPDKKMHQHLLHSPLRKDPEPFGNRTLTPSVWPYLIKQFELDQISVRA